MIEGTNLGISLADMDYIIVGQPAFIVQHEFVSVTNNKLIMQPLTSVPSAPFGLSNIWFGFRNQGYTISPNTVRLRSCMDRQTSSYAASYNCGGITLTDFNPKTIPLLGATVTVTGTGFSSRQGLTCSAANGHDPVITIVSDTIAICPLGQGDVAAGYSLYIWDGTRAQSGDARIIITWRHCECQCCTDGYQYLCVTSIAAWCTSQLHLTVCRW